MASPRIQATPPSQDAMLDRLLTTGRHNGVYVGLRDCDLEAEMPLLLNRAGAPVACMEPSDDFEAVNAHFSVQVHAFFNALHTLENMADEQSPDETDFIRKPEDGGLHAAIRILNQSYDIYADCWHRTFHNRRLTVQNPDTLPLLNYVTRLRVLPAPSSSNEPDMHFVHMRPVSPRVPLGLAARLPHLRELDCPWLWERLPLAFSSQALRIFSRPWEGPWRDARVEFGRGVRQLMPSLPSSLIKARLWFWRLNPYGGDADQAVHMPDLVGASPSSPSEFEGMDPVSLGLRDLGSCLAELNIRALITPDLFRSSSWPHMRHLRVEFHPCAPDGRWYFSGPRGEDPYPTGYAVTREEHYPPGSEDVEKTHALMSREEDEFEGDDEMCLERRPDMFRILPIAERIDPLLLAFVSSLRRQDTPSLEDAEMFTWLQWRPSKDRAEEYEGSDQVPPSEDEDQTVMFRWGVRYDAPDGNGKGKVTWQVGEDWRPGEEVIRAFEELVGGDGEDMEWEAFEFVGEREMEAYIFD
ncbi:hypothetical protein COL940_011937 [Colletotrichum noveboracense]|nr:hypothetical protein COL940_011937 [Colletotrichum noveboracense]KAJ0275401.1 hypothetical protein CBS470a_011298 [Colletotrichum nupharicola]